MKVGFIGLGRMGTAMANRILGAGHDIAVYNRTASKCADLVAAGAKLAGSAADAARFGDVDQTFDAQQVRPEVLLQCVQQKLKRGA